MSDKADTICPHKIIYPLACCFFGGISSNRKQTQSTKVTIPWNMESANAKSVHLLICTVESTSPTPIAIMLM
jgi:hypothetical protein